MSPARSRFAKVKAAPRAAPKVVAKAAVRAHRIAFATILRMGDRELRDHFAKFRLRRLPSSATFVDDDSNPEIESRPGMNLQTHLMNQIDRLPVDRDMKTVLLWLVERTNPKGYLVFDDGKACASTDEAARRIAEALSMPVVECAECLERARSLDPAGVFALNERDRVLLRYIREYGDDPEDPAVRILRESVEYVSVHLLAERFGVDDEEIGEAMERMKTVGRDLDFVDDTEIVYSAETFIDVTDSPDGFTVRLAESRLSDFLTECSAGYDDLLNEPSVSPEEKKACIRMKREFEREYNHKLRRDETLETVAAHLCKVQEEFLRHGEFAHRALSMDDVARDLGMHKSLVGRAVEGKTLRMPSGRMIKLRELFSYRLGSVARRRGAKNSQRAAIALLRSLVNGEDKSRPYSDAALAKMLTGRGYPAARTTVRKYRFLSGIPDSRERRGTGRR